MKRFKARAEIEIVGARDDVRDFVRQLPELARKAKLTASFMGPTMVEPIVRERKPAKPRVSLPPVQG